MVKMRFITNLFDTNCPAENSNFVRSKSKVPYPNKGDRWTEAKRKIDEDW